MKIPIIDKYDLGIMSEFTRSLGATVSGRFTYIPESKGAGYITGFSWGNDLRMMIRNYYLNEDTSIEWTNETMEEQEYIVFMLNGVLPPLVHPREQLLAEQANILIFKQGISSTIAMPSNTIFGSVTIRASRHYLHRIFGEIDHPIVASVLQAKGNFVFETVISSKIIDTASEMLHQHVPENLESHYYKLKCEKLLCYIFALIMERETVPISGIHMDDIKVIYAIRSRLRLQLNKPPDITSLVSTSGMSETKMRKLFKQTFGKGIFEYYQSMRMQDAAKFLKEKRLMVSEVGYLLGFTNLSHFSKVFEKHHGIKPKKYSLA